MSRLRRPSGAMVVACAALFTSLGGGAYAAVVLPANSVGSKQLQDNAVSHNKLKPNSVWHNSIGFGSVQPNNLSGSLMARLSQHNAQGPKGDPGAQGPQGPQGSQGPKGDPGARGSQGSLLNYEVDNGANWALAGMPLALANAGKSYEDAGIVVDIGPASGFSGITKSGTGDLKDNVWITDGSQAYSPGFNSLSRPANFTYGTDNGNGTYYMMTGPDAGKSLTPGQIAQNYKGYEAYAWVGITSNGTSSATGHVASVNNKSVSADLTLDGTTTRASG